MPKKYLNFPFDEEVFNYKWKNTPDLFLDTILTSGAVQRDSEIANLIANGSNIFDTPYYDILGGEEQLYDGIQDFSYDSLSGGSYRGVVYSRMKAWDAISFIKDFNSGADPMGQIAAGVAGWWQKQRQAKLVGILSALFGITGSDEWDLHTKSIVHAGVAQVSAVTVTTAPDAAKTVEITVTSEQLTNGKKVVEVAVGSSDTAAQAAGKIKTAMNTALTGVFTVTNADAVLTFTSNAVKPFDDNFNVVLTDANESGMVLGAVSDTTSHPSVGESNIIGATTINDLGVQANGDHAENYSLAIMHSKVANDLANLQLLEYSKYTDPSGITRNLPIGTINGKTVVINDNVPVKNSPIKGKKEYTTYLLGNGSVKYEPAPVERPSELARNAEKAGGTDMIYTRNRECFAPYGFSFTADVSGSGNIAVPDSTLYNSSNWNIVMPKKSIFLAQAITN